MADKTYDCIVIGAGPGGYVAAIRAAQLGLKTVCIDKEYLGGVCLNWGCIPSKALIAAAGLVDKLKKAEGIGITVEGLNVDVKKLQQWKDGIVKKLTGGVGSLLKGNGADVMMGTARLTGKSTVEVKTHDGKVQTLEAKKGIILATGASTITLPGFEPDNDVIITAREAVSLQEAPKTMLLVGGGVIGLELGMVYQKLGTKVIVVELTDQLLPGTDLDLVKVVEKHLKKGGADIHLQAKATKCEKSGGRAKVTIEDRDGKSQVVDCDKVLVAVGFRANSKNLGLEEAGVKLDQRGNVVVDDKLSTNVKGIWSVGDLNGPPFLAHKASKEGEIAAEIIAGHKSAADWLGMPAAIFTDPEIATVGLTETQAKKDGKKIRIGKFPFAVSGRAMAVLETDGFVKVIVDEEDNRLLGVGIVGPEASDLISESALAIEMCAFAEDVALTVHPHPTLGEATMEAFKHALREAIHVMNR